MKSIKPGRGPSMMSGIVGIAMAVFGVIWTAAAASMGAPGFFVLFGLVFIAIAVVSVIYNFKNATSKNRFSSFDITDGSEESDPLNERFGNAPKPEKAQETGSRFCPYCGEKAQADFEFCAKCGKKLP